jgi:hypothetical protein
MLTPSVSGTVLIGQVSCGITDITAGVFSAIIYVEDSPIRFWLSGDDPTITSGIKINSGDFITLSSIDQINSFRAISLTGTDATLQVQYYK